MTAEHPFALLRTARAVWIGHFCARELAQPPQGPRFPALISGQSTKDWLVNEFYKREALRDNLREAVVDLITTPSLVPASGRDQVLGTLLHVAGALQFHEIKSVLAGWVRDGWINKPHYYQIGSGEFPLRRIVWSLLIGWQYLDDLMPQVLRDLKSMATSGESGTAQVCFVALGKRDPATALELIPDTAQSWPAAYWYAAVKSFFVAVGPDALLKPKYLAAWRRCLGRCFFQYDVSEHLRDAPPLAETDVARPIWLRSLLQSVGITVKTNSSTRLTLLSKGAKLEVSITAYTKPNDFGGFLPPHSVALRKWRPYA